MRRLLLILIVSLSILFVGGAGYIASILWCPRTLPTPTIEDIPQFTQDEVAAMAKRYLRSGYDIQVASDMPPPLYMGSGKWRGVCVGDITRSYQTRGIWWEGDPSPPQYHTETATIHYSITWNFYEKSQTIEIVEMIER